MKIKYGSCIKIILITVIVLLMPYLSSEGKTYRYVPGKIDIRTKLSNRGAVVAATGTANTSNPTSFKSYKVIIKADKLNIRKSPSNSSAVLGVYVQGNIIDVIGKSGSYLKTNLGYIAEGYTKNILGMYISVQADTRVIRSSDMKIDDRTAMAKKYYKIVGSNGKNIMIKIGKVKGFIPQSSLYSIVDTYNNKISLAWEYVNKKSGNEKIYNDKNEYVNMRSVDLGLDVLSPSWFDVTGDVKNPLGINVEDIGDAKYVTIAHKNGYEVWARFSEMNRDRAKLEFNDKALRAKLIGQLIKYASVYDLDGYNIDFEALGEENRDGFTSFMKELYASMKKLDLNISVDITRYSKASSLYSLCYDRPQLAKYSDYLILMGYDEHVSSSKEPGSVGSYNWVQESIRDILKQGVSNNKLILAVPFYLRDYSVISEASVLITKKGKLYNAPILSDSNKLLDGKRGDTFKCIGSDGNWYIIDYNGNKGYILKKDCEFVELGFRGTTTNSALGITGSGINVTTGEGIELSDMVILNNNSVIYKTAKEIIVNSICDTRVNDYYKYMGIYGDWFIIAYNGKNVYVHKSQGTYIKAESRAISSSSMTMKGALERIESYRGSIYRDEVSKQDVGIYFKDGVEHIVWLETNASMEWRMGLINEYDLAGAAVWSLYWKPTEGIWDVIKNSLKLDF